MPPYIRHSMELPHGRGHGDHQQATNDGKSFTMATGATQEVTSTPIECQ